jgi:Ca2+-transporting ATPase
MLTGESIQVEKNANAILKENSPLGALENMVFSGTLVTQGRAVAYVTAIGNKTELGQIAKSIESIKVESSPLQKRLKVFSKVLSISLLSLITFIVLLGLFKGFSFQDLFLLALSLTVSAIPEGLPLAITLCLIIGVQKMASQKAIVKDMASVETLGATSVICTDKTGTLTCNQMTVKTFFASNQKVRVSGVGYGIEGEISSKHSFKKLALVSALCHETSLLQKDGKWVCEGDPTEASLIVLSKKLKFDPDGFETKLLIPFESETRFMAMLASSSHEKYVLIKGALDKIILMCDKELGLQDQVVPLNEQPYLDALKEFSKEHLRTLALAYIPINDIQDFKLPIKNAILCGLVGIEDPLRENVEDAIATCHNAGIEVKMITGDHPETALAIYKKINRFQHDYKVLSGVELDGLSAKQKNELIPKTNVFARVSPLNKLEIIETLQNLGKIVAMTGDGVNDAPSLKKAHIGVAMGSGSDVSKDAAKMILLDDNFITLEKAVEQGRMIYQTLKNLICYLMITASGGVLLILLSVLLGFPLPLSPIQFLWINLVTDGSSTLPMCFEKTRPHLMNQKPINPNEPLFPIKSTCFILMMSTFMSLTTLALFKATLGKAPEDLDFAKTIAFTTLALFQILNVQNCRSLDQGILFSFKFKQNTLPRLKFSANYPLFLTMGLAFILQILATEWTALQPFLQTKSLSANNWLKVLGFSSSIIVIAEVFKYVLFLFSHRRRT